MFHLTITAEDTDAFVADPDHTGVAAGWVESDLFGGRRPVEAGIFNLFTAVPDADPDRPERRMLYRLPFSDAGGNPLTLVGHKVVRDDPGLDLWPDTSTLYIRCWPATSTRPRTPARASSPPGSSPSTCRTSPAS